MTALIFDHRPRLTWGGIRHWWEVVDRPLIACAFFLLALGIVLNFATSPALAARNGLEPFYYVIRQGVFAVPAILLMLALSMASPKVIRRFGVVLFCMTIALLMLVLLIGASRNGSQRWLSFIFFSLQPSELVKPALVAVSAWMFSVKDEPHAPPGAMVAAGCLGLTAFLVALQPDYSQTALDLRRVGHRLLPVRRVDCLGGIGWLARHRRRSNCLCHLALCRRASAPDGRSGFPERLSNA